MVFLLSLTVVALSGIPYFSPSFGGDGAQSHTVNLDEVIAELEAQRKAAADYMHEINRLRSELRSERDQAHTLRVATSQQYQREHMRFADFMDYYETTDEYKEYMKASAMEALGNVARRCRTERDFFSKCRAYSAFTPLCRFYGDASRSVEDIEDMLSATREGAVERDISQGQASVEEETAPTDDGVSSSGNVDGGSSSSSRPRCSGRRSRFNDAE